MLCSLFAWTKTPEDLPVPRYLAIDLPPGSVRPGRSTGCIRCGRSPRCFIRPTSSVPRPRNDASDTSTRRGAGGGGGTDPKLKARRGLLAGGDGSVAKPQGRKFWGPNPEVEGIWVSGFRSQRWLFHKTWTTRCVPSVKRCKKCSCCSNGSGD